MTVIAGLLEEHPLETSSRRVWLAGDSAQTDGWAIAASAFSKVIRKADGAMLLGSTGNARLSTLLRFDFTPPRHPEKLDTPDYLGGPFLAAVREVFGEEGYRHNEKGREEYDGGFLVAYRGLLALVDSRFGLSITQDFYHAIGCGGPYAVAALHVMNGAPIATPQKLVAALETAEHFSSGVRGPMSVDVTPWYPPLSPETLAKEEAQRKQAEEAAKPATGAATSAGAEAPHPIRKVHAHGTNRQRQRPT